MTTGSTLGETAWADCESVIRRFENAWRDHERPDISSFIPAGASHASQLLVELVHIDLEFRLRAGESTRVEEYLVRFPEIDRERWVIELIDAEYSLRNRHCPPAWPEEYWLRFPQYLAELRQRFPVDGGAGWLAATRPAERDGPPLFAPPVIPGYEMQGELGRGGMGVVYQARDLLLHRTVAIKTFASLPRAESCARFAREAESIARMDHPHIVPVYEVGQWHTAEGGPGVPYFVMKWYTGGSMDAAPSGPGTDVRGHAEAVETIARAVHHAHQRGVLHRDLKPSNILLDDEGRPHVADFGLAGRVDPDARTATAIIAGTPAYMAPEQARTPNQVSTAADVYGLGAILYHQLTGKAPFAADTPLATLEQVVNTPPPRPSEFNSAVPRDLDTICLKCLEKEPSQRYSSAAEVADDLDRWRRGLPISARPTRAWEHAWRGVRRHPVVTGLVVTTIASLIAAIVVLSESNARIRAKEEETANAYAIERELRDELQGTLRREEREQYLNRVALAGQLYAANQLPQAWQLLDQCPVQFRGWEWRYLDSLRRTRDITLVGHTSWIARVGFLPDGRVVSGDTLGFIRTWDPETQKGIRTWKFTNSSLSSLAVHPKRNWVAVADSRSIAVWNVDNGRKIARLAGSSWVAFNPDGTRAITSDGPVVRVWIVPEEEPKADDRAKVIPTWEAAGELRGHESAAITGAVSPDGKTLATSGLDRTIRTWDLTAFKQLTRREVPIPVAGLAIVGNGEVLAEAHFGMVLFTKLATGEVRDRLEYPVGERTSVVAGPNPNQVAVSGANGEVVVWDVERQRVSRVFRGHRQRVSALAFGPGDLLASGGGDETVRLWHLGQEQGLRTLAWVGDGIGGLAVSPDGARFAVGPRSLGTQYSTFLFDSATAREVHRLDASFDVCFHPSGHLLTGRNGGGAIRWDPVAGKEVWSKPYPKHRVPPLVAAPGGRRLAVSPNGSLVALWDFRAGGLQLFNANDGSDAGLIDTGKGVVYEVEFTPDSTRVAVATYDNLLMWDVRTRQPVPWAEGVPGAVRMAFSPDGKWLVTVGRDRSVRLREAATGREVRTFIGNSVRVTALSFCPDSVRLLTGGSDRTVRVWDVESGRELLALPGATHGVTSLTWDPRNDRILALDFAVRAWGTRGD